MSDYPEDDACSEEAYERRNDEWARRQMTPQEEEMENYLMDEFERQLHAAPDASPRPDENILPDDEDEDDANYEDYEYDADCSACLGNWEHTLKEHEEHLRRSREGEIDFALIDPDDDYDEDIDKAYESGDFDSPIDIYDPDFDPDDTDEDF